MVRWLDDFDAEWAQLSPHLVLMDLMLPGRNGYHWCRLIRRISQVPILFLTSAADNLNAITAMAQGRTT